MRILRKLNFAQSCGGCRVSARGWRRCRKEAGRRVWTVLPKPATQIPIDPPTHIRVTKRGKPRDRGRERKRERDGSDVGNEDGMKEERDRIAGMRQKRQKRGRKTPESKNQERGNSFLCARVRAHLFKINPFSFSLDNSQCIRCALRMQAPRREHTLSPRLIKYFQDRKRHVFYFQRQSALKCCSIRGQ